MFLDEFEFLESVTADRRSPNHQAARDAGSVERHYRLRRLENGVSAEWLNDAHARLLGYSYIALQPVTFNSEAVNRRYIRRVLPHAINPFNFGGAQHDSVQPWLYAHAVEECVPVSGHNTAGLDARPLPLPDVQDGYLHRVCYKSFPYQHREDSSVLAENNIANPLSATYVDPHTHIVTAPGGGIPLALPDEGDVLRSIGWLGSTFTGSRYIAKRIKDRTRQITLPQGMVYYDKMAAEPNASIVPTGLPFYQIKHDVSYTWIQVPLPDGVPLRAMDYNRGRTNGVVFDGYPVGTLAFIGLDFEGPYQSGVGNRWYVDITYRMEYLPNYDRVTDEYRGWNSFPRVVDGQFRYIYFSTNRLGAPFDESARIYPRNGNFSALFRPDQPTTGGHLASTTTGTAPGLY
jgi:hypothetical protein